MKAIFILCLMTQLTYWRIALWMNPFVLWVPFPVFVPSLPLFESIFSAVTIPYFVPMHTYLSCHCKHQWQSLYSFICFSFTILFVFHTSVCLKAGGVRLPFFFHSTSFFFFFYVDTALFSISIFCASLFGFSLLVYCLGVYILRFF